MVKRFRMSLKDLDPEGIVRHEDVVGLKQIELWYLQAEEREARRQQARQRTANKKR